MRQRVTSFVAPFFLIAVMLAAPAAAQTDTASIVGTVSDDSGGVLPGVTVTATQDDTGIVATAVTNSSGQYVFPGLRVGRYSVAAELQGFKRSCSARSASACRTGAR